MRWLVLVVISAACTADNPEFDRAGTTGDQSGVDAGDELEGSGGVDASDAEEEGSSDGAVPVCGPLEAPQQVELKIDGVSHCTGIYFAVGVIELVTEQELQFRCNADTDSMCPPGSLAVLTNGWGFPPELGADPTRVMQMQYEASDECGFAAVEMKVSDDVRLKFTALGAAAIFGTVTDYEITAKLVEMCDCSTDCCGLPAGRYVLEKSLVGEPVVLGEGEEAVAELDMAAYRFHNFASHVDANCGKTFHWQAVLL